MPPIKERKRIAIVGSGVSGIAALWALNEHSEHEVNIYEAGDYVGGHTHTVTFEREGKESVDVDTSQIVCNPPTYPNFLSFLAHKKVRTIPTSMTFSVSRDLGLFEWAGDNLSTVFIQRKNLLNPRLWRMLLDVLRFNLFGLDLVDGDQKDGSRGTAQSKKEDREEVERDMSIGEYLERGGYGDGFKEDYLLVIPSASWSTPADKAALDFPAKTLVRFFHNHHLMQVDGRPNWLTVSGGSKKYVEAVLASLPKENLHTNTPIKSVTPHPDLVTLVEESGKEHQYDYVIMATHSDTSLRLLKAGGGATREEEDILSSFEWSKNEAVLHWDERFMPIRRRAWSAWNYLTSSNKPSKSPKTAASDVNTVALTYNMNDLQKLPVERHGPVLVTLNPPFEVDAAKTVGRYQYEHPMYSAASVRAQSRLPEIQNARRVTFAGAWTNYGFHEDGFTSGLKLAVDQFGAGIPFPIRPADRAIKKELIARAIVAGIEHARVLMASTPLAMTLNWLILYLLTAIVRLVSLTGRRDWVSEAESVCAFWRPQQAKGQRKKMQ
ncbi:hypothetical protein FFLO_05915 [Filobasidium floriforme]|uniref:Amine oxidase domain-containing protein n=1 Tax=Filobasidium floriforme TaxID=5210 RepID=A0A8K0JHQ6_9TREE|nr:hypothetical protein FFLO_05915 [Filobasidium floriforme]